MKVELSPRKMDQFDVAIVGMSCRFPGAQRYRYFWENLINGVNSIREVPIDRWDINKYYSSDFNAPGKSISKWGGFLDDIGHFDNKFFNISPREAKSMDPQQRVLLEETWKCVEDSGIPLSELSQKITSVYVGVMAMDYYQTVLASSTVTDSFSAAGNYGCILANRLSYYYGFRGVSMTLDTACSASLVALNTARRALYLGESDYIVVAGVNLNHNPFKYISFSKARMLSPDGQCKTFDKDANGYVPGEGVGILLLQPLENAVADGNHILGIIKGSSSNHVGRSVSMTAPRVESQVDLILDAYKNAGIDPSTVNYVEAHGTGTSLGDPIEVEGLTRAFREYTDKVQYCKIGSVKSNIGHLEACAGLSGIIKVLLMFKHKKIPRTLNVQTLNPIIDFVNSPFEPALEESDWDPVGFHPRRASVSSFGFGGVNAHVILEEYVAPQLEQEETEELTDPNSNRIFILSANSKVSLEQMLVGWKYFVGSKDFEKASLDAICRTLKLGREVFPFRYGVVIDNKVQLKKAIQSEVTYTYVQSGVFAGHQVCRKKNLVLKIGDPSKVDLSYFMHLYETDKLYKQSFSDCKSAISEITFLNVLHADPKAQVKYQSLYTFSIVYSLIRTILNSGISPDVICGEGLGQWVALCISGVLNLKDCLLGLLSPAYLKNIVMARPRWPLYLQSHNITIRPFYFDNTYKQHLIKGADVSSDVVHSHIHKANLLISCQFTFKKLMEEWNRQFSPNDKTNLDELLKNNRWWEMDDEQTEYNKVLLLIIVLSSLRSLNQKWNLTENLPPLSPGAIELLDLISDKLITQEEVIQLLSPGFSGFSALADCIHSRQAGLDLNKPYEFLRKNNVSIRELEDRADWIEKISLLPITTQEFDDSLVLKIGHLQRNSDLQYLVDLPLNEHVERNLANGILSLWLKGRDIQWKKYTRIVAQKKVTSLPAYFFDQKTFWLESKQDKNQPKENHLSTSRNILRKQDLKSAKILRLPELANTYQRVFSQERDMIIQDHLITEVPLVPGASFIELGLDSGLRLRDFKCQQMTDVTFLAPGVVAEELVVRVTHDKQENRFEIVSDSTIFCSGQLNPLTLARRVSVNPQDLMCGEEAPAEKIYRFFLRRGYRYGPSLQVIHKIWKNRDYHWAELRSQLSDEGNASQLNPALLDGVFQVMLWVGEQNHKIFTSNSLFVPHKIQKLIIHDSVEQD